MNTIVVSRRVQWALLIFLVLTLIVFAPLLIAVGIALTVAITVHPFYTWFHRYFRISERSSKTELIFAVAITLVISFGMLTLLALPVWIIVENREDIISGGREILEQIEQLDFGALFAGEEEEAEAEQAATDNATAFTEETTEGGSEPAPPEQGHLDPAEPPEDPADGSSAETAEANASNGEHSSVRDEAETPASAEPGGVIDSVPFVTDTPPADPAAETQVEREADPLITPEQIKQAVTGLVTSLLSSIPMFLLSFFIFASVLYLSLRTGASLWRRLLNALETQTSMLLQKLAGTTYRTLYAIYVVHFTTVVITFFLAIPLFLLLQEPYSDNVLLWSLICALFQLVPFLGPSLIIFSLIGYEFFRPEAAELWWRIPLLVFYGYLFVAIFPDWIIRPLLMGRTTGQNSLVMWLGFFGGIAVMGPAGFVFGPLILALLNDGINIVLQHYPDPMKRARRPGSSWDSAELPEESRRPFGDIGGHTSGQAFLGAGATAEEDEAIRESNRPRSAHSTSQAELPALPPLDRGAAPVEESPPDAHRGSSASQENSEGSEDAIKADDDKPSE